MTGDYEIITPAHILGGDNPNFDGDFTGLDRNEIREFVLREQKDHPHLYRQAQERLASFLAIIMGSISDFFEIF